MKIVARVAFVCLIVGVTAALAGVGQGSATISLTDCGKPTPSPSGSPPVPQPTLTPPPTDPPPSDAPPPPPERTPGPDDCIPKSGDAIWDTQTLAFKITPDSFHAVKRVTVAVKAYNDSGALDASGPLYDSTFNHCGNAPTDYRVPWDTQGDTPRNGKYQVVVTATTFGAACNGSDKTSQATRNDIRVDNAPDPVNAPSVVATTQNTITIQWDASNVPDLTRYEVYRAITSSTKKKPNFSDFKLIGYSAAAAFRDSNVKPNVFWYSVIVTRRSVVTPSTGISSIMSGMSHPAEIVAPKVNSNGSNPGPTIKRYIPLSQLVLPPTKNGQLSPVPDAPYSAQLPYGNVAEEGGKSSTTVGGATSAESGFADPRGPVLPVAVGAFLVSAALALGRMPY